MSESGGSPGRGGTLEPPPVTDDLLGLVVLGCRLEESLGRGASGTVYRARQLRLHRDVAVKLVPIDDAVPGTASRFEREVRAIAALHHPHVVPLFDAGEQDGLLVLVMGLVQGDNLKTLVQRRGPLTPDAAVGIVRQIGSALDVAHRAGLVHRDVKPGNILLSDDNETGGATAYLADFGLARSVADPDDSTVTLTGHWVGTPAYAAPEQRAGATVGPAADLYALAGVLSFLLTGTNPGGGPPGPDLDEPTRRLLEIARSGMAELPAERFPTARALVTAAEDALEDAYTVGSGTGSTRAAATVAPAPVATPTPAADGPGPPRSRRRVALVVVPLVAVALAVAGLSADYLLGREQLRVLPDETVSSRSAALPSDEPSSAAPSPSSSSPPSGSPTLTPSPASSWPTVSKGDNGRAVRTVQLLLTAAARPVEADGFAGSGTETAIRDFQRAGGLPVTGAVDPATWVRLARRVQRGDTGPAVDAVQLLLRESGYWVENDGEFGDSTEDAVAEFQTARGLAVDGLVGTQTWLGLLDR